jgi:hypothetical protein
VSRGLIARSCAAALVAVALIALGVRLVHVHEATWEWTLRPSAAAPLLAYGDRDYKRSRPDPGVEPSFERIGTSLGGGAVFGPPLPHENAPVYLQVRDGDVVYGYVLLGGP